jgi:transcriptional regulator with XRE-family HTH domain
MPLVLPEPGPDEPSIGAVIRDARVARGWSQRVWAAQYVRLRTEAGRTIDAFSAQTQLSAWENNRRVPDHETQAWIAESFDTSPEALFGLHAGRSLPRPLMLEYHVTPATIELIDRQRAVHTEAEHAFGPRLAAALVNTDLRTIESLVPIAPERLSAPVHALAARVAELAGWIAQECGELGLAKGLSVLADDYAQGAGEPALQAMIHMRRANIVCSADPRTARDLLGRAAGLVGLVPPGRLHAAIARQQAHVCALLGERPAFERFSAAALDYSQAEMLHGDLAPYAHPGYVTSETAAGLIVLKEAGAAADLLADHGLELMPGQERDHGVAMARWLYALVACGDYKCAAEHCHEVATAYLRAPSQRAKMALRAVMLQRDANTQLRALQDELRPVIMEGLPPS